MFRKSTLSDVKKIMEIIKQAQESLKELGIDQWQDNYPNSKVIENDINNDCSYILKKNNEIISTIAISFDGEENYENISEGEWITGSNSKYAVIHRVAASNSVRGSGIANKLFKYAENLCKENNIPSVKIDTHEGNIPMQKFLNKNGYKYCGVIYLENGDKRVAFEKVL